MPTSSLSHKNWQFQSSTTPILSSHQLDELTSKLNSSSIPEMVFNSKLEMRFFGCGDEQQQQQEDVCVSFEAPHALQHALKPVLAESQSKITPLKVHFAWDKSMIHDRIMNEKKEIEERVDDMDWTFSTCYKGTCVKETQKRDEDTGEQRDINENTVDTTHLKNMRVFRETKRGIDYERLTQKDEILFYDDVILFEDELHDAGMCILSVKVRVMQETFFCLLRYFLRVDNVVLRILDTRYYHVFGSNEIIREYSHRENTIDELGRKNPILMRDPKLLDMPDKLQGFLDVKEKYNEVLYLDESLIPEEKLKEEAKLPKIGVVRVTSRHHGSDQAQQQESTSVSRSRSINAETTMPTATRAPFAK
uniref:TIP41-like protein n=1 Tax=Percolomonas cosmopolitus TaxID=63605 RepID=A0A7S1KLA3_9EUKA|eukprot:CAMPEP_0117444908 /NCGR_PEP_ID=MMETSP0759-20121206/5506_1 /TAXON_ID=63605 /ORGANISM="Percolomonas cosmopolitus, Strain WS" /LENGTH=362 /DNA_ID=CAMNT_0005237035 /DNA_START=11 /DNA_END=1099 /DNA_ORIENTATION=+